MNKIVYAVVFIMAVSLISAALACCSNTGIEEVPASIDAPTATPCGPFSQNCTVTVSGDPLSFTVTCESGSGCVTSYSRTQAHSTCKSDQSGLNCIAQGTYEIQEFSGGGCALIGCTSPEMDEEQTRTREDKGTETCPT